MLDSYEEGQRLYAEDFADPFYMPEGKYEYCEVVSIGRDVVELSYHSAENGDDQLLVTRAEMARMLGWDLNADDVRYEEEHGGRVSPEEFGLF